MSYELPPQLSYNPRDRATQLGMYAFANRSGRPCPFKDGTRSALWWQQGYDMAKQRNLSR
jgi:hypothetical protein